MHACMYVVRIAVSVLVAMCMCMCACMYVALCIYNVCMYISM